MAASPLTRWRLYLVDPRHGSLGPAGPKAWNVLEGRYALCVLFEYAATLGVVDVAYTGPRGARDDYRGLWGADGYDSLSRYDGLAAVRVNELGAAILHDPGALPALGLPVPRRASVATCPQPPRALVIRSGPSSLDPSRWWTSARPCIRSAVMPGTDAARARTSITGQRWHRPS